MSDVTDALDAARAAYRRRDWQGAHRRYLEAERDGRLAVDDLAALADAAWWLGHVDEALDACERVFHRRIDDGETAEAAMAALDIGFMWFLRGETVVGSGWIGRCRRLLANLPECAAHGYALTMDMDEALDNGSDLDAAMAVARRVRAVGERFADPTLIALGLVGEGVATLRQGQVADGMAALDEAMLPVMAGHVAPTWAGNIYCRMMAVCHELSDLHRARQWTAITERWCEGFSGAVMFAGICRVHRVQLLQVEGAWLLAETEALQVCVDLADMNLAVVAEGQYQVGEARRLRGDHPGAESAYTEAHRLGRDPQPGLALLRLAQGRTDAAAIAIAAATATATDPFGRARLRRAQVEIAVAADDPATAAAAADDLDAIAARFPGAGLEAMARTARGAVILASGDAVAALPLVRDACRRWQDLDAPYEVARVRVLLAEACAGCGDDEGAVRERTAASAVFDALGATTDADRLAGRPTRVHGLTGREVEVLSCVAAGQSNREVAATLFIAEKTVARHLSNIFAKLTVSSRTEAAAFAYRNGLVSHRRG